MTPTVGRIVYYKSLGSPKGEFASVDRAAIITQVQNENNIGLCVLNPNGMYFNESVSKGSDPGQWDWMPYQKGQASKTEEIEAELNLLKVGGTE